MYPEMINSKLSSYFLDKLGPTSKAAAYLYPWFIALSVSSY
jgi:hypothetical protein